MIPTSGSSSKWIDDLVYQLAMWGAEAAKTAVDSLFVYFGPGTEPDFTSIVPVYDRMLAVALLVVGSVIALGIVERILGGTLGLGFNLIPRTLVAVSFAFVGWELVQYIAHYAALLATTWSPDFIGISHQLQSYKPQLANKGHLPIGSLLGLFFTALFTILLSLLIYLELVVRGALILLATAFIPLVAVLSIWPRMTAAAVHLGEFLLGLLLSKFVVATAVYIGYGLIMPALLRGQNNDWFITGLAILMIAAFSPVVLMQSFRVAHGVAGSTLRDWTMGISVSPFASNAFGIPRLAGAAGRRALRSMPSLRRSPKAKAGHS